MMDNLLPSNFAYIQETAVVVISYFSAYKWRIVDFYTQAQAIQVCTMIT